MEISRSFKRSRAREKYVANITHYCITRDGGKYLTMLQNRLPTHSRASDPENAARESEGFSTRPSKLSAERYRFSRALDPRSAGRRGTPYAHRQWRSIIKRSGHYKRSFGRKGVLTHARTKSFLFFFFFFERERILDFSSKTESTV